jgi:thiamine pyrophosphokinase
MTGVGRAQVPHRPRAVVLAGGELPPPVALDDLWADDPLVIAADSGLDHADALGVRPHLVVGDMDSASSRAQDTARAAGVEFETHPTAKDATDLELALLAARARDARVVTVVGAGGGRLDHLLANVLVLTSPELAGVDIDARIGTAQVTVVRRATVLRGAPGDLCSLLPVGGVAREVRTDGLRFPLRDEDLLPGSTRGISNELLGTTASVDLASGVLLAVQPTAHGEV